jgi:adenine deaminase
MHSSQPAGTPAKPTAGTPAKQTAGNIVDVVNRRVRPGSLIVEEGRIVDIRWDDANYSTFLIPGFVDAHIHVESSLLPPREFARLAVVHGTVAAVSDPHEIANVLGTAGVDYMLDDARGAPLKIYFGAPSCVPATPFDRAGSTLSAPDVARLLDRPEIKYLSEMMNYPGVLAADAEVLAKLAAAHARGKPVDGHAPRLRGEPLARYAAAGISTDHECFTLPEALEKLSLGMKVLIREGSAARNFDELVSLLADDPDRCMLCSDDKHPHQLVEGHIDQLVRRALARGINLMDALRAACVNPVLHYGLDVGLLRPGDAADFLEVDDLQRLHVRRVFIDGRLAAADGRPTWPRTPSAVVNQFQAREKVSADFQIPVPADRAGGEVRVIEALDGQLVTGCLRLRPTIVAGCVQADPERDLLKIALVDRYENRPPVTALVKNFGLRRGAIASSVSHDSHNIVAVGTNDDDLCRAVNRVIASRGGLSAVSGTTAEVLPLPIAGLMSDQDGPTVARQYAALDHLAKTWGSTLEAPFMTLSFMALTVIPSLKLGPSGLFDVDRFTPVDLFCDES